MKKTILLSFLLAVLISMVSNKAFAYDIAVENEDGVTIYYRYINGGEELEVTNSNSVNNGCYSGDIVIPSEVVYDGQVYKVTKIGLWAFLNCSELISVTIPEGVKAIQEGAFMNSKISDITLPSSIMCIHSDILDNTPFMEKQPDGIVYVGDWVLGYKGNKDDNIELSFKNGTIGIGADAFKNHTNLKSIIFSEGLLYINIGAFHGCNNLSSIILPNSLNKLGNGDNDLDWSIGTFSNCTSLRKLELPDYIESFGANLFSGCINLTSIKLPTNLKKIGSGSFRDCSSLVSLNIPNSVTSIGGGSFSGCSSLTSINIPNGVTSIGNATFSGCSSLTSINIPNGVTSIGNNTFYGCSSIASISLPNSVSIIGKEAFGECSNLSTVDLPENISLIDYGTFYNCQSLVSINIPSNVTSIGSRVFYGCKQLTTITIPSSLTSVGFSKIGDATYLGYTFYDCNRLNTVIISDLAAWCNISFSGNYSNPLYNASHLFLGEKEIKDLILPDNITSINTNTFQHFKGFSSITIPNNVTTIDEYAFSNCSGLTHIVFPENLQIIKRNTFSNCVNLKSLTLPASVEFIYQEAFSGCNSLSEIKTLPSTPPFVYNNSFSNYNATLKVPDEGKDAYIAHEIWGKFGTIQTLTGDDVEKKTCATPTIYYSEGKLSYKSETEGATFNYMITDTDIQSGSGDEVQLTVTYHISVYASKEGYQDSEVAEATLCWIEVDPQKEGITEETATGAKQMKAMPVLIQANDGQISVEGAPEGTKVAVYDVSGVKLGSAVSRGGKTLVPTRIASSSIAIVKIGERSFKVAMK